MGEKKNIWFRIFLPIYTVLAGISGFYYLYLLSFYFKISFSLSLIVGINFVFIFLIGLILIVIRSEVGYQYVSSYELNNLKIN